MKIRFLALAILALSTLAGCRAIGEVFRPPEIPAYARLEVWNRTSQDVFLMDTDRTRLDVPACGHAIADRFRMNEVRVRTADGYVSGFGSSNEGSRQYMVLVATSGASFPSSSPPVQLPPCAGRPVSQPESTS